VDNGRAISSALVSPRKHQEMPTEQRCKEFLAHPEQNGFSSIVECSSNKKRKDNLIKLTVLQRPSSTTSFAPSLTFDHFD
jgi:hypothetical protein